MEHILTEQEVDDQERAEANYRLRQYRCENLFWRLWGLPVFVAETLAEKVWETETSWSASSYHRSHVRGPVIGFDPVELRPKPIEWPEKKVSK